MFGKKKKPGELDDGVAMRIVTGSQSRDVSYRELLLSTNLSLEALLSVLVRKGIITPDEVLEEIQEMSRRRGAADGKDPTPGASLEGSSHEG